MAALPAVSIRSPFATKLMDKEVRLKHFVLVYMR